MNPYIGYELTESIDLTSQPPINEVMDQIKDYRQKQQITTVLINTQNMENDYFNELVENLYFAVPHILIVPKKINVDITNSEIYHLAFNNLFVFDLRKGLNKTSSLVLKRVIDIIGSFAALVLASPLLLLIAILIKLEDGGPAFFPQTRFGLGGKVFKFYKFRSMHVNGDRLLADHFAKHPDVKETWDRYQKIKGDDPRVTRIGRFIRATSLDELPQLLNIFIGDMSFIGPRPYLPREKDTMGKYFDRILAVKPGLTGLWQVSGRNRLTFKKRLRLDIVYIQNWTFWLDIVISVKTIRILFEKVSAF